MVGPRNDEIIGEYAALIGMIRARISTFDEKPQPGEKLLVIRHDVDHDLEHAVRFARMEARGNIFATYFLLPTAKYFDYSEEFEFHVHRLLTRGHQIGLHNNALAQYLSNQGSLEHLISKPLKYLRSLGADVRFTAAHGDGACYEKDFVNFHMWKECERKINIAIPQISLKDYGLQEVYFLPRDCYLSDSGGRWRGGFSNGLLFERDYPKNNPIKIIQDFNSLSEGSLHLLVHPIWWE